MSLVENRIAANHTAFQARWLAEVIEAQGLAAVSADKSRQNYKFLVLLNSWDQLFREANNNALEFFQEARNDAVLSHVLGSLGYWRSALKSLRSLVENSMFYLYYRDHPVELAAWAGGAHRIATKDLLTYFETHPHADSETRRLAVEHLRREYKLLSKAVHASAASFRMTNASGFPKLRSDEPQHIGPWLTRFKCVMTGLALLFIALHKDHLQGTVNRPLRRACGYAIAANLRPTIRASCGVNIF